VAANPVNGSYWAALAAAQFESGDFPAAVEAYQRVLELGVRPAERGDATLPGGMPVIDMRFNGGGDTFEDMPFELPVSKLVVNVADLYWQTGYPMDRRQWIAPQLYAPPTFEAFSRNHDPALAAIQAASEYLPGSQRHHL